MTKIVSWNVNSIRVRLPHLIELSKNVKPDVIMLQETKSTDENFPNDEIERLGYKIIKKGQKSYNGVAILSKLEMELLTDRLPGDNNDEQARYLEVIIKDKIPFQVASIYLPNGNPIDTDKFPYKLDWMRRLKKHVKKKIEEHETIIFGGDYNIIPSSEDAIDINKWKNDALHHPESI